MINYKSWEKELTDYSGWLPEEEQQPDQPEVNIKIDYNLLDMNLSLSNIRDTLGEINERLNSVDGILSIEEYILENDELVNENNYTINESINLLKNHIAAIVDGACIDFDLVNDRIDKLEVEVSMINRYLPTILSKLGLIV